MIEFKEKPQKIFVKHIDIKSESVQEIINTPPSWLVRWGMTVVIVTISVIFFISWLIKYPQIIKANFKLSSINAPKAVKVEAESRLIKILVKNKQSIRQGQILAHLESTASPQEMLNLEQYLGHIRLEVKKFPDLAESLTNIPEYLKLGEIQQSYQTFVQSFTEFNAFLFQGFHQKQLLLLQKDLGDLDLLVKNLREQLILRKKEYQIALEEFQIQQTLAQQNVIAPIEFKREQSKLLSKEIPLKSLENQIIQNQAIQTAKQKEILELENRFKEQKYQFIQSINTLNNEIKNWKKKHLLIAPLDGIVHYSGFLQEKQTISTGDIVFLITPNRSGTYYGEITLGQQNFGEVKKQQKVLLTFDSYSYEKYGKVWGEIDYISDITAQDSLFFAKIKLPNGLHTTYDKQILYKPNLKAQAEIIAQDRRLIEVFLQELNKLWQY